MGTQSQNAPGKIYAVIVLSIVAGVMAYFRFVRNPKSAARPAESAPAAAFTAIPELPASLSAFSAQGLTPRPYKPPRRDIFAPPPPPPPPPNSTASSNYPPGIKSVPAPGPERPRLTGIMQSARGPQAIINGKIVRTGDRVGEYTVASTGLREVVLTSSTNRLILTLGR